MKITKIYETIINISAKEMYSNIDTILMDKLRVRFENKCEKNSLIVKIIEIVKRSKCKLTKSRLDGSGDISVQFKAEAIIYTDGDIITGCEIQKIEGGNTIICKYDIAIVKIKGNRNLQSLKSGQKITVKILSVSYPKGNDKITIDGAPYSYSYKFTMYSVISDISGENIEIIKKKLQEVDNEYKLYETADVKAVKFFNNIYYPFKENFDDKKKSFGKLKLVDFYDIATDINKTKLENVYLLKHPAIDKSIPQVFQINKDELEKGMTGEYLDTSIYQIEIIEENIAFILLNFLNDYLTHIKAIREMTEIYNTEKDIEFHLNIWGIYNRLKK